MYQNAGEKGRKHADPDDPPRRRANKVKGHGTWDNDRPPIAGVVGRESGKIRLGVCHHSDRQTLQSFVEARTPDTGTGYTDEWQAYNHLPQTGRGHAVCAIRLANASGHGMTMAMAYAKYIATDVPPRFRRFSPENSRITYFMV